MNNCFVTHKEKVLLLTFATIILPTVAIEYTVVLSPAQKQAVTGQLQSAAPMEF